jgi:asparagine synthase (glutamine-hydrolysing)
VNEKNMLTKLRAFASLYRELGPRWTLFRLAYAFRLRTGMIRLQMPMGEWNDYKYQRTNNSAGRAPRMFFSGISKPDLTNAPWNPHIAVSEADRLLNGELKYFSRQFIPTGFPPNWHTDYVTLNRDSDEESPPSQSEILRSQRTFPRNDMKKHWSQISDEDTGDIKFIWEPNRFAFVYPLVRAYAVTHDEKYPEAFWTLIEDWALCNPPNTGPNWMDGQEIALRLMAWIFGYHAFLNSPSTTQFRISQLTIYIAAQAERIYKNIGYAVSTRSNHTISEAFGLWMVGLLFPELKQAEKYLSLGKRLLEQEAVKQIFPDGSYAMYSLNYHRFILHIYLYAIRLSKIYQLPFTNQLINAVTKSIEYLSHLIDLETGEMPVYGSNDGALVLPLNTCDFTDYRPLLQLGWYVAKGERLFEPGPWDEDLFWLCGEEALIPGPSPTRRRVPAESSSPAGRGVRSEGEISFPHGGTYLLRSTNSRAVIRCTDFASRPSHADQLHVDLWIRGRNLAIDAGTYLYSGEGMWRNGLAHTAVHNTVTVDGKDQMTLLSRFTWTNWSRGTVLRHDKNLWQGEHDGYKPVSHKRTVMSLEGDRWLVIDHLFAKESRHYALHWLLGDVPFEQKENSVELQSNGMKYKIRVGMKEGNGKFSIVRADPNSTRGWRSRYYGHKEPALSVMLETNQPQVTFWTFFGVEGDRVELSGDVLNVNTQSIHLCRR